MKALRNLVFANAVLAVAVGFTAFFKPDPFLTLAKPWQVETALVFAYAFGGLGLALWYLGAPAAAADRRRLALGLAAGNGITAVMAGIQEIAISRSILGGLLLLPYALLAAAFFWVARRQPPGEPAAAVDAPERPGLGEIRQSWLRQVGEAAAQEERNRLARDLHDSIKQQLFSIHVGAATVQERWETDPQGARAALADVRRSAHEAMVEMQALLQQLRPQALAAAGLVAALREQCEALGYRSGAEVALELGETAPDERLPPGAQEALFRIAQEALANVARHARARHVRVRLGCVGERVELRIEDDGQGFDPPSAGGRGMGLRNLRERSRPLGGTLEIDSAPGQGTSVVVSIPLLAPPTPLPDPGSPAASAARLQTWALALPAVSAAFLFLAGRSPAAPPSRRTAEAIALLAVTVCGALWSHWQASLAEDRAVSVRRAAHRLRAFLFLVGFWAIPWTWRPPAGNGAALPLAWLAAVLAAGAAALATLAELAAYRRASREPGASSSARRSWATLRHRSLPVVITVLLGGHLLLFLTVAFVLEAADHLAPPQLGLLLSGLAVIGYVLWREAVGRSRREAAA